MRLYFLAPFVAVSLLHDAFVLIRINEFLVRLASSADTMPCEEVSSFGVIGIFTCLRRKTQK
jgi:hypothetical protein